MAALEALLFRALTILLNVLGIVSGIKSILSTSAQEHSPFAIETIASNAANTVNSPAFGNAELKTLIDNLATAVAVGFSGVTVEITSLTDGTTPVSLPVTPPSGYGGLSFSDTGHAVWDYSLAPLFSGAKYYMQAAGNWGAFSANLRWLGDEVLYFQALYGTADYVAGASDNVPVFDPTDILISEDALACLTRQNSGWTVTWAFAPSGYVRLVFPGTAEIQEWQTTFDQAQFAFIKSQIFPLSTVEIAPVWPGIAKVTIGTPVAITSAMTITEPMHGVIVDISAVGVNKPQVPYDGELAYKFIGALAFVDDNGQVEMFQSLGFTNAIYCCRDMSEAASVVVRADPSLTGTITPWVIA